MIVSCFFIPYLPVLFTVINAFVMIRGCIHAGVHQGSHTSVCYAYTLVTALTEVCTCAGLTENNSLGLKHTTYSCGAHTCVHKRLHFLAIVIKEPYLC